VSLKIAARGRPAIISDNQLLDVARAVFLERGLDATTADVAERARVSTSLIFYRYKTKEALFTAVLEREMQLPPIWEALHERAGKGRVADVLFDTGAAFLDSMSTAMPLCTMAFSSNQLSTKMHDYVKRNPARQRMMKLLGGYLRREVELRRLNGHEPEVIANAFIGGLIDYLMNQYMAHGSVRLGESAEFLRKLIALLLQGCAGRGRTRSKLSRI
jgi:AcrR family transcriptional regulator